MEGDAAPGRAALLVLGAGPAQVGLLRAARELGIYVIAVDRDPRAPGFRYADRRAILSSEDEPAVDRLARSEPIAGIVAHGMSAERYAYLHTVPAIAMQNALKKAGRDVHDLGLLEINEAFASVALNAARMLGVDDSLVNVNGGAVALGHPIGASGARLVLTLALEMRRRGIDLGGATLCGGGGQGDALIIERAG